MFTDPSARQDWLARVPAGPALRGLWLALFILPVGQYSANAVELVMFEEPGCGWCAAWDEEIGIVYHKTDEGRRAPLRRIDMTAAQPPELSQVKAVVFSPTFVLIKEGEEIGRIVGYPGEQFFWPMLQDLLDRLAPPSGS